MSDYNWCHNPDCHTYLTTDRIRGVKGSKVSRTRKIKVRDVSFSSQAYYWQGWENHFCRVACFFEYVKKHITDIIALAPVHAPSEKPIDVQVKKRDTYRYRHTDNGYERVPHVEKVKTIIAK